jgi:hypothetical protein
MMDRLKLKAMMMSQQSDDIKPIPARFVIYSITGEGQEEIDLAKAWVKKKGFTSDDVKINKDDGSIIVVTKREIIIPE